MTEKDQRGGSERQKQPKKRKRMYDETKAGDTGEEPLYPPKGGSYIHH